MKSYQTLSVVGGVLGIIVVFTVFVAASFVGSMLQSFGKETPGKDQIMAQIGISIILYMVSIIIPFVLKKTKILGSVLLILAFATLISAGFFGVIGFALLLTAGIVAIRWKEKHVDIVIQKQEANENALDVLKTRYAKGEITKEQFDEMKKNLD